MGTNLLYYNTYSKTRKMFSYMYNNIETINIMVFGSQKGSGGHGTYVQYLRTRPLLLQEIKKSQLNYNKGAVFCLYVIE